MKLTRLALAGAMALAFVAPAAAKQWPNGDHTETNGVVIEDGAGNAFGASNPQAVNDNQSAPFTGAVAMTPGTTYAAGRLVEVDCTTSGNVTFTFSDGSTRTRAVYAGTTTPFAYAITKWVGDATFAGSVFNMK